jgi:hypothetical protein
MLRVRAAHTCVHRAEQLLEIVANLRAPRLRQAVGTAGGPDIAPAGNGTYPAGAARAGDGLPVPAAGATQADLLRAMQARS